MKASLLFVSWTTLIVAALALTAGQAAAGPPVEPSGCGIGYAHTVEYEGASYQQFNIDADLDGTTDMSYRLGPAESTFFVGNFQSTDTETIGIHFDTGQEAVPAEAGNIMKFAWYDGTGAAPGANGIQRHGGNTFPLWIADMGIAGDWAGTGMTYFGIKHANPCDPADPCANYRLGDGTGDLSPGIPAFYTSEDTTVVGNFDGTGDQVAIYKMVDDGTGNDTMRWNFGPDDGFSFGQGGDWGGGAANFVSTSGPSDIYVIRNSENAAQLLWLVLYNEDFGPQATPSVVWEFGPKDDATFTPLTCDYDGDGMEDPGFAHVMDETWVFKWISSSTGEAHEMMYGQHTPESRPFAGMFQ